MGSSENKGIGRNGTTIMEDGSIAASLSRRRLLASIGGIGAIMAAGSLGSFAQTADAAAHDECLSLDSVRLSMNVTIVNNAAKIRLKGGGNLAGTSSDYFVRLNRTSGIWFEVSRSF